MLLPQPDAREGRDRLEVLAALISAPSFDPLFRPDIIKIPAGHPVYRWNCLAGCERTVMGHGDLCGVHQDLWRRHRGEGGTRTSFLQAAQPLGPGEGVEEQPCRICPDRPSCHLTLRLCHHHQWRWYNYRPRHRSEEHTSELQSRRDLVCRLLLEKKKNRVKLPYRDNNRTNTLMYA